MNPRIRQDHMFLNKSYISLARDRKKIIEFGEALGRKLGDIYPPSIELDKVSRELMHNSELSLRDKELLEERRDELRKGVNRGKMQHKMLREPLVDEGSESDNGPETDTAA